VKETYKTVDYDWLTRPTGDVYADAGGYVLEYLSEKYPEKDILELIEYMARVYVTKWDAKIDTFFLNSTVTHHANKGEEKVKKTKEYFASLLQEKGSDVDDFCRITGRKGKLFKAGRDNSLMSGSRTFANFHHNFQSGMMLSKEMLIRMFFVPYGTISVGGRVAVIHSNDAEITCFFVRQNCRENDARIAHLSSEGVLKSEYTIPTNALFHFVDDVVDKKLRLLDKPPKSTQLTLYHFSNFGATPKMDIFPLPSNVFYFYSCCQAVKLVSDWRAFLFAHYIRKGAIYDETTSTYDCGKAGEKIESSEYKLWRNAVLEKLLKSESLAKLFRKWSKKHEFNFRIVELYQLHVRNMKKETVDKIKDLASFLTGGSVGVSLDGGTKKEDTQVYASREPSVLPDYIKKSIVQLRKCKQAYELRRFLLQDAVIPNYDAGNKDAIITVEDMIYYLFPDDVSWMEIRDLLLVAIYQELHERKIRIEVEDSDEDDANEDATS
jgi:CRISPR-associated protein Cst1